jgi:biotin operon repressor
MPGRNDKMPTLPTAASVRQCSICQVIGHNSRTCPSEAAVALRGVVPAELVASIRSNRTFGIEVEFIGSMQRAADALNQAGIPCSVQGHNHSVCTAWKVVTDGSVSAGGELVSPILSGAEGLTTAYKAVRALAAAGLSANRSCGLHVHVGAVDTTSEKRLSIARRYAKFESQIDSWMAPSRRANASRWCQSIIGRTEGTNPSILNDRYFKVNLTAFSRHQTIEFRQHQGTVNAKKVCNWVKFCVNFVEESLNRLVSPVQQETPVSTCRVDNDIRLTRSLNRMVQYLESRGIACTSADVLARDCNVGSTTVAVMISNLRTRYGYQISHRRGQGYRLVSSPLATRQTLVPVVAPVAPMADDSSPLVGLDLEATRFFAGRVQGVAVTAI